VRHGLFHFDRDAGPSDYDPNGVTWTNETNGAWDWWYPVGLIPYDVTNISTMSFLMAGNSTLEIETSLCGPEGCPTSLPVCRSCGTRHFKWSTGDVTTTVTPPPSSRRRVAAALSHRASLIRAAVRALSMGDIFASLAVS